MVDGNNERNEQPEETLPLLGAHYLVPDEVVLHAKMEFAIVEQLSPAARREKFVNLWCENHLLGEALVRASSESNQDPLTGLSNRRAWDTEVADRMSDLVTNGTKFAVMLFDLDKFKELNDGEGHAAGDAVLQIFAATLSEAVREEDMSARLGGDEFGAVIDLSNLDSDAERNIALESIPDRVRILLQQNLVEYGYATNTVTFSSGRALANENMSYEDLFQQVDTALYADKATKQ